MKAYTVNNHLVGVGNSQILGTDQGGGSAYTAGQYISIDENNVISVTGVAPATAIPDTSDMATKTWVGEQGYLTSVPSEYATDTEVSQAIASSIPTFTEGNCIDITSNAISWETTAGITDIVSAASLPANPVATVLYLIPET